MSLKEEILSYTDQYGLVTPNGQPSGNGLLYSAEYLALLDELDNMGPDDVLHFHKVYYNCEKEKGLYNRHPNHTDQQGPDDYVGIATTAALIRPEMARDLLAYGRNNLAPLKGFIVEQNKLSPSLKKILVFLFGNVRVKYNYNNVNPGTTNRSSWLGRQPQLITTFQMAAKERVALPRLLYWCLVISTSGLFDPKSQDAWSLSYLSLKVGGDHNFLTRLTRSIWRKRFKKHWPGGLNNLFATYFNNPEHPLAKYWPENV